MWCRPTTNVPATQCKPKNLRHSAPFCVSCRSRSLLSAPKSFTEGHASSSQARARGIDWEAQLVTPRRTVGPSGGPKRFQGLRHALPRHASTRMLSAACRAACRQVQVRHNSFHREASRASPAKRRLTRASLQTWRPALRHCQDGNTQLDQETDQSCWQLVQLGEQRPRQKNAHHGRGEDLWE